MPFYNNSRIGGAMDGTHIYFNTNISNDWSSVVADGSTITYVDTNDKSQDLEFNQTRAQPYLANPSEYYMSVQRFTIESPNLPVFIAQPIVGTSYSAGSYQTIYRVTVQLPTLAYVGVNVLWIPQDLTATYVPGPITANDYKEPIFYCYSYSYFIEMINTALASLIGGPNHPFMQFNPVTGLFSIQGWVDKWRTKSNGGTLGTNAPCKLFFNTELYNLFSSLSAIYVAGGSGLPNGADYQILFTTGTDTLSASPQQYITNIVPDSYHNIPVYPTFSSATGYVVGNIVYFNGIYYECILVNPAPSTSPPNTTYWKVVVIGRNDVINYQEYTTLPLWTPIKSIVFTASLLNIVAENIATPVVYENGNQNINAGKQNTDILPILIEHSVPQVYGTEYKPFIFYEPQGEYRLSDLYSEIPIAGLQYKVYWKDTFGNLIPFKLAVGASATLKILFRKKLFNSDQV